MENSDYFLYEVPFLMKGQTHLEKVRPLFWDGIYPAPGVIQVQQIVCIPHACC